ncbi:MAG: acetate kinase [Deltaproteobacteria bacterium]|nr:acetate kinase [Deltaproteobacteria bacterium]
MRILVVNCGSSSLKFKLYDLTAAATLMAEGLVEEIGREKSRFTYKSNKSPDKRVLEVVAKDHTQAVAAMKDALLHPEYGLFQGTIEVDAVGHRVVHGGEKFSNSALVTPGVRGAIAECIAIAPLHNPPNLAGITACETTFPGLPQVAVFDTAFHQTMPPHVFMYGLPYEQYDVHHIRKYGFHGTSHEFVARRCAELLKKDFDEVNLITCHLGNGSSITAVKRGKSFDTSMGLTPLEGVLMGTRTGDMDPAVVLYIMDKQKLTPQEMNKLLNNMSGVKGISGVSNDMRLLLEKADAGHRRAQLALDIFVYRIVKYIGAYVAAMGGADAIVFTGGIGENATAIRARIIEPLAFIGAELDPVRNGSDAKEKVITTDTSRLAAWVVPTNEELSIAQKTRAIVESQLRAG